MTDKTVIPLTDQQLDEIEARVTAATAGPWGVYEYGGGNLIDIAADLQDTGTGYRARREICRLEDEPLDNDPTHREWTAEEDWAQVQADAKFIAHAPDDVRALLTKVRRLQQQQKFLLGQLAKRDAETGRTADEALREFLDGDQPSTEKPLPDGFERHTCVTVACAVCGYRYDEAEFTMHFPSVGDALDGPVGSGWDVLKDGRVLCMSGEEKHDELRHTVGVVDDSDA